MKKFLLLLQKEVKELLTPQMIVPFIATMLIFVVIGKFAGEQTKKQQSEPIQVAVVDQDRSALSQDLVQTVSKSMQVEPIAATDRQELLAKLNEQGLGSGIIIPKGFAASIANEQPGNLETVTTLKSFNILTAQKSNGAAAAQTIIDEYLRQDYISGGLGAEGYQFTKAPAIAQSYVAAGDKIAAGNVAALMSFVTQQTTFIPIILFLVIIVASQMIATAVATEKENKTLETLLSLPISRRTIVVTKMLAAGLVALLMAAVYMFGMRSYMNGITGASSVAATGDIAGVATQLGLTFSTGTYVILGVILFLGILLALAMAMILGSLAEDTKSAQGVITPLMMMLLIPYFLTMFTDVNAMTPLIRYIVYAIPFSHIFLATPNILLGHYMPVVYGGIYLLVLFVVFVWLAARIFSTEKVLTIRLNFGKKKTT